LRKRLSRLPLVCALVACAALVLAACGGGESDDEKIEATIVTAVKGNDPASCTELLSQRVVEQLTKAEGREAIAKCEESAAEDTAVRSLRVADVRVADETATAEVSFAGGTFDGQTVTMDLVEEDGQWKVDELTGFAGFDSARLLSTLKEIVFTPGSQSAGEEAQAECILEELQAEPDAELEGLLLDPGSEVLENVFSVCVG